MCVNVLILAGARTDEALKEYSSAEHEALIKIADIPMVEYVIKAVKGAEYTGKIAIVGPRQALESSIRESVDLIVDSGDTLLDNIKRGIEVFNTQKYLLLVTCDIPLITKEVIDEFIMACLKDNEADIYYPIIPKEKNLAKYPSVKRTYFHLAEGTFTGGNMVMINPRIMQGALDIFEKAIIWRKKPWKLSQLLGLKCIFKFVIGNLSINEIETRVAKITGYKGRGMITQHPEVGFDVDKPSDLILMRDKYIL
jgi:GTP:adenosylcobinamide-phosphate guanylyltransferase